LGKMERDKGMRREREIVAQFQAAGIAAERVPLSGMNADRRGSTRFKADVTVPYLGIDRRVEVKARKDFKTLYGWLADNWGLVLRGDRMPALMVMPLAEFIEIQRRADLNRTMIVNTIDKCLEANDDCDPGGGTD
jgi:hypothetical protein